MERHVLCRCALLLLVTAMPEPALAEQPVPARLATADPFDLVSIPTEVIAGSLPRTTVKSQVVGDIAVAKREKTRLRLTYQPSENGPRFEIGTIGSRKGAMKSRLFHVAVDWIF